MSRSNPAQDKLNVSFFRVLRAFAPDLWRHRRRLAASYSCGILAACTLVAAPWPLKFVIDHAVGDHPLPSWLEPVIGGMEPFALVLVLTGVAATTAIANASFSALETMIDARVRERLGLELRDRLLRHIQILPLAHRNTDQSGEHVLRLVDDVFHFVRLLTKTIPTVFRHLFTVLVTCTAMFLLEPRFGLLGLVVVILLGALTLRYADPLQHASRSKRKREGDVAGLAQEIIRGLPSTRALGAEEKVRARFTAANALSLDAGVHETRVAVGMERTMEIIKGVGAALVMGGGALLVLYGNLTIGALTVGLAYLSQLLRPVAKINQLASSITRGSARGEQLLAIFDRRPDIVDAPDAVEIGTARGAIAFRDVTFAYATGEEAEPGSPVLQHVNLEIAPRQFTVIVGPSGSGKSTLLGLMLRLFDPQSGEVLLDGTPLSRIRLGNLRAQFSVMLQETHLFAGSVRESLQPAERDVGDDAVWVALRQVALEEFVRDLPGQLDAALGEDGVNLSGGQRARFSLARALLSDAPILLLDEPLSNIDRTSRDIILDALSELRGKRTCIAVTHQMALTRLADVVLEFDGGKFSRKGPDTSVIHPLPQGRPVKARVS